MPAKTSLAVPIFTLLFVLPASLRAQQWSAEEQQVLEELTACWDIWMEGIKSRSPERWIKECSTPTMTFWWGPDGAPNSTEFLRRNWKMFSEKDLGWVDMRPVAIRVVDDLAVLHFYGLWRASTANGETITEAKRTEVFRRIDGRWRLIAGHATPVTPEDALPYRSK